MRETFGRLLGRRVEPEALVRDLSTPLGRLNAILKEIEGTTQLRRLTTQIGGSELVLDAARGQMLTVVSLTPDPQGLGKSAEGVTRNYDDLDAQLLTLSELLIAFTELPGAFDLVSRQSPMRYPVKIDGFRVAELRSSCNAYVSQRDVPPPVVIGPDEVVTVLEDAGAEVDGMDIDLDESDMAETADFAADLADDEPDAAADEDAGFAEMAEADDPETLAGIDDADEPALDVAPEADLADHPAVPEIALQVAPEPAPEPEPEPAPEPAPEPEPDPMASIIAALGSMPIPVPVAAADAPPAPDPEVIDKVYDVLSKYCELSMLMTEKGDVLKFSDGALGWCDLAPDLGREVKSWVAETARAIPGNQMILLRSPALNNRSVVLVSSGDVTAFGVITSQMTGRVFAIANEHLRKRG